jgi:hypothetical protein
MCHRFQRGRTLEEVHTSGGALWCSALARAVCVQEGMDLRCKHRDTTSCALPGAYVPSTDAQAIRMTHGDSNAHRPAWQPAVVALLVSHDGGVPCVSQSWEGHTSATPIVPERAQALRETLQRSPTPRDWVADCPLDPEGHAAHLHSHGLSTRLPHPLTVVAQVSTQALRGATWPPLDAPTRSQRRE